LGLIELMPDGRVRVQNPALLRVGRELRRLGFGVEDILAVAGVLFQHSSAVADAFVSMFMDVHWRPYAEAGMPPDGLPRLRSVIEALQPLASQAVVAAFQQTITDSIARAMTRESTLLASVGETGPGGGAQPAAG
jgi:hypothetical protein